MIGKCSQHRSRRHSYMRPGVTKHSDRSELSSRILENAQVIKASNELVHVPDAHVFHRGFDPRNDLVNVHCTFGCPWWDLSSWCCRTRFAADASLLRL